VSVQSVEGDDLFCGFEERGGGFVFNEDGMTVATEEILVEKEAGVPSDGSGINEALVVYTDRVGGEETVDARAEAGGIAVSFCQSACSTVEVRHNLVDDGRGELGIGASPNGVIESGSHVCSGGMPHSFVQPEDVADDCGVQWGFLGRHSVGLGLRKREGGEIGEVQFIKMSARILATTVEELVIVEEAHSEVFGEPRFDSSFGQMGDRDEGVGSVIDDGNSAENWSKVGIVGAPEFTVVAEGDLEWVPGTGLKFEACQQGWIDDGAVGDAVNGLT